MDLYDRKVSGTGELFMDSMAATVWLLLDSVPGI